MDSDDEIGKDPKHPDSVIRLASSVHRFYVPEMGWGKDGPGTNLSFVKSFKTAGHHASTRAMLRRADMARLSLAESLSSAGKNRYDNVITGSREYLPLIHQVLASCKAYPDGAVLDEKLVFEWSSGVEKSKASTNKKSRYSKSEALMYELIMVIVSESLAHAGMGCDATTNGKFPIASKSFKISASIFDFLAKVQLPKWVTRGESVTEKDLPAECSVGVCEAMKFLFLGIAQQMAVATALMKPEKPKYLLVAKLCLGICSLFEDFSRVMRNKANHNSKFDKSFFTLLTFQVTLHKALSFYFQARDVWDKGEEYGLAITMLNEASSLMRTRSSPTGKGIPEIESKSSLRALNNDIADFKAHISELLSIWELDNSTIYFCRVPDNIPDGSIIPQGLIMMKPELYSLDDVNPLPLSIPSRHDESSASTLISSSISQSPVTQRSSDTFNSLSSPPPPILSDIDVPPPPPYSPHSSTKSPSHQRSDSDIARELQAQLNGSSDEPPPYSAIEESTVNETRPRSDSDLARELQEKLNAEQ